MLEVPSQVDRGHAATPERALEHVAVAQAGGERGGRIGERGWGCDGWNLARRTQQRQPRADDSRGSDCARIVPELGVNGGDQGP